MFLDTLEYMLDYMTSIKSAIDVSRLIEECDNCVEPFAGSSCDLLFARNGEIDVAKRLSMFKIGKTRNTDDPWVLIYVGGRTLRVVSLCGQGEENLSTGAFSRPERE